MNWYASRQNMLLHIPFGYEHDSIFLSLCQSARAKNFACPDRFLLWASRERDINMSKENCTRNGCKDVFHAFLVKNAQFDTELEIPCIKPEAVFRKNWLHFQRQLAARITIASFTSMRTMQTLKDYGTIHRSICQSYINTRALSRRILVCIVICRL